jgi:hypothetical protein
MTELTDDKLNVTAGVIREPRAKTGEFTWARAFSSQVVALIVVKRDAEITSFSGFPLFLPVN